MSGTPECPSPSPSPLPVSDETSPKASKTVASASQHDLRACTHRPTRQVHHPERNMLLDVNLSKQEQMLFIEQNVIGNSAEFATPFGQRHLTYADYTASGRSLQVIEDMIIKSVLPFYANTHTASSHTGRQTSKYREEARAMVADSVNAHKEKDVVLFCGSGSTAAISKLLLKLQKSTAWQSDLWAGRQPLVIVGPHEHHSNVLPWRESGAKVVQCKETAAGLVDVGHLEQLLTQNAACSFKAGSFSAGSNVTGILCPVDDVAILLHQHRALVLFDYAGAGPYIPIDMNHTAKDPLAYHDAIFLSPHKFVGGPQTPGVLVCKRKLMLASGLLDNEAPAAPGGGTVLFVSESDHRYVDVIEEREEGGTPDIVGAVRCGLVFRLKDEAGAEWIERQEGGYVRRALATWRAHPRITLLGPAESAEPGESSPEQLSILSFLISAPETKTFLHHNFVCALLNDLFGIQARSGCACAGPYVQRLLSFSPADAKMLEATLLQGDLHLKPGFTRVNLNYFLPPHIIDFIIDAVCFVADHAPTFLPLYTCALSGEWSFRPLSSLSPPVLAVLPASSPSLQDSSLETISPLLSPSSSSTSSSSPVTSAVLRSYLASARALALSLSTLARQSPSPLDAVDPTFSSPEASSFLWFLLPSAALTLSRAEHTAPHATAKLLPASVFGRPQAPANAPTMAGAEQEFPLYLSHFEVFATELMDAAKRRALADSGAENESLGVRGARNVMVEAARKWREMPEDERARFGSLLPGVGLVAVPGARSEGHLFPRAHDSGHGHMDCIVQVGPASGLLTWGGPVEAEAGSRKSPKSEGERKATRGLLAMMTERKEAAELEERDAEDAKGRRVACFPRALGSGMKRGLGGEGRRHCGAR